MHFFYFHFNYFLIFKIIRFKTFSWLYETKPYYKRIICILLYFITHERVDERDKNPKSFKPSKQANKSLR